MDYLLIEGTANVGKTGTVIRLANRFIDNGWKKFPDKENTAKHRVDFLEVLEKDGKKVVFNSASDMFSDIEACKGLCDSNQPIDLLITSLREEKYSECNTWKKIFKFLGIGDKDKVIEFPLAKITKHRNQKIKEKSIEWYGEKVDEILRLLLKDELNTVLK